MKKELLEKYLANFTTTCQKNNLKVTPQRIAIFKELIKFNDHPSATDIYTKIKKKFPYISFDTVNRTLQTFVEIGISRIVKSYEAFRRYDAIMERHHHFYCIKCHKIIDVYDENLKEVEIPTIIDERFKIIDSMITFNGICDKCEKE